MESERHPIRQSYLTDPLTVDTLSQQSSASARSKDQEPPLIADLWSLRIYPAATRRTVTAQGEAERNPGTTRVRRFRPNGADGWPPKTMRPPHPHAPCAPLRRGQIVGQVPGVSPRAVTLGPVGARQVLITGSATQEPVTKAKQKGLGYGL